MTTGLRLTPEQYAELIRKRDVTPSSDLRAVAVSTNVSEADARVLRAHRSMERFQALGRLPKARMNNTEKAYSEFLEERKRIGKVIFWKFHPLRVRLADNTFYEVDFLVLPDDYVLEIHETKGGFTTDKGQLKLKLCGEALPIFRMFKVIKQTKKAGGGWSIQEFSA